MYVFILCIYTRKFTIHDIWNYPDIVELTIYHDTELRGEFAKHFEKCAEGKPLKYLVMYFNLAYRTIQCHTVTLISLH